MVDGSGRADVVGVGVPGAAVVLMSVSLKSFVNANVEYSHKTLTRAGGVQIGVQSIPIHRPACHPAA